MPHHITVAHLKPGFFCLYVLYMLGFGHVGLLARRSTGVDEEAIALQRAVAIQLGPGGQRHEAPDDQVPYLCRTVSNGLQGPYGPLRIAWPALPQAVPSVQAAPASARII